VFFLVDKSDVFATFKTFIKRIHNEFETTIKKVRSDNRSEFKNIKVNNFCDKFRIRHQFLAKYTPQSNGLVERKNKTLIDMARSMLSEYNVSYLFWIETINTAYYYSNRLYYHPLKEKTPYELLNDRKPNIAYFWLFYCKCYILKKDTRLSKFEKKYDEGFLLGYSTTSKSYRIWNLTSGTLEEVHDVKFDETNGSQKEDENLDNVRGTQLVNAMKNMDIDDIRPREVIDVEDNKNQVLSNSNMQAVVLMIKIKLVQVMTKCKINNKWQVHHLNQMSNQVLQPTNIERDHHLDSIIDDILRDVQTRLRLTSFCEHFSFVSSIGPKKIDEALLDVDRENAMHE
jgi:hypothetical protein